MKAGTGGAGNALRSVIDRIRSNKEKAVVIGAVAVLCVMIAIICCPSPVTADGTDSDHGITWSLHADGTLKFSGSGEIIGPDMMYLSGADTDGAELPEWYAFRDRVKTIDIGKEVRHVGLDAFVNFTALRTLTVRGAMTELDFECIRYDTPEGGDIFRSLIVWGPAESSACVYAEYNSLEFRTL